jgi:hypothetical protein
VGVMGGDFFKRLRADIASDREDLEQLMEELKIDQSPILSISYSVHLLNSKIRAIRAETKALTNLL